MPLKAVFLLVKQFFFSTYGLFHFGYNTLWGFIKLWQLPYPRVTLFGGSRVLLENKYARQAHRLAELLVNNKIAILTGGGSGIMQAGTLGATHKGVSMSLGVGARGISELCGKELCATNYVEMDYFFSRKWILINHSQAFVAFPGGFGTMNEIAEVLTFIQKGVLKKTPLILIGVTYWQPFIEWLEKSAIPSGLVDANSKNLILVTDDIEKAADLLIAYCASFNRTLMHNFFTRKPFLFLILSLSVLTDYCASSNSEFSWSSFSDDSLSDYSEEESQLKDLNKQCDKGSTPLIDCVKMGSISHIKTCLSFGAALGELDRQRRTALTWAIIIQRPDIVDYLLSYKEDGTAGRSLRMAINKIDLEGFTPVMYAAKLPDSTILKKLLADNRIDLLRSESYPEAPLDIVVQKGDARQTGMILTAFYKHFLVHAQTVASTNGHHSLAEKIAWVLNCESRSDLKEELTLLRRL